MPVMTVGSLFAGIGGFDLGFERAGFEVRWQVEIDDYAHRVLARHWPHVARYGDIRAIDWSAIEPVDVICGGFPCQPHSTAGRRLASADERDLWSEFARAIRGLRPRWVVAENVPGLLSSESGRFFGRVLGDLAACGYDAEWDCISAADVGAPHLRERVWVVAYPNGERQQERRESDSRTAARGAVSSRRHSSRRSSVVADADSARLAERKLFPGVRPTAHGAHQRQDAPDNGPRVFPYTNGEPLGRIAESRCQRRQWEPEPDVGRVAHGVPARVDRLRGLGNAIVPQIAEWIARRILEAEALRVA